MNYSLSSNEKSSNFIFLLIFLIYSIFYYLDDIIWFYKVYLLNLVDYQLNRKSRESYSWFISIFYYLYYSLYMDIFGDSTLLFKLLSFIL